MGQLPGTGGAEEGVIARESGQWFHLVLWGPLEAKLPPEFS